MANFDLSLLGDKQLAETFKTLPEKLQRKYLRESMRKVLRPVLAAMRARAPRRSGRMARSLKLRAGRRRRHEIRLAIMTGTREELGIDAKDPYYYPAAVELGTRTRSAQPFMRSTYDSQREQIIDALRQEIDAALSKEWQGR